MTDHADADPVAEFVATETRKALGRTVVVCGAGAHHAAFFALVAAALRGEAIRVDQVEPHRHKDVAAMTLLPMGSESQVGRPNEVKELRRENRARERRMRNMLPKGRR